MLEHVLKTLSEHGVSNVKDGVIPIPGSVLVCDLTPVPNFIFGVTADHTGIYIGNNKIIHRSGDGCIEIVSPQKFLQRLDGINCADTIYVACNDYMPIGGDLIANRAKRALHDESFAGYDLLNKNCHHFTRFCLTGDTNMCLLDFTYTSLETLLINNFNVNHWRKWYYDR